VLRGVSLEVRDGEIVAIIGPNGAGKSTVLRAIYAQCDIRRGDVLLDGARLTGTPAHRLVARGIAGVPQGRAVFPSLTVQENLDLGVYHEGAHAQAARLAAVWTRFPVLGERRRQRAGTLSGGEQQMLALARALLSAPRLLLLDEPSLGLAPLVVREIFRIVRTINQEEGVSVLLVEQNAALALELADHAYLMETGRVVLAGPSSLLQTDESIRRSYLGY
jgi:branched-chain amino acid transport system ATP-binding protein